jgi:hypothetical protein
MKLNCGFSSKIHSRDSRNPRGCVRELWPLVLAGWPFCSVAYVGYDCRTSPQLCNVVRNSINPINRILGTEKTARFKWFLLRHFTDNVTYITDPVVSTRCSCVILEHQSRPYGMDDMINEYWEVGEIIIGRGKWRGQNPPNCSSWLQVKTARNRKWYRS